MSQSKHSSTSSPAPIATKHLHYIEEGRRGWWNSNQIKEAPCNKFNQLQIQQWFELIFIYSMLNAFQMGPLWQMRYVHNLLRWLAVGQTTNKCLTDDQTLKLTHTDRNTDQCGWQISNMTAFFCFPLSIHLHPLCAAHFLYSGFRKYKKWRSLNTFWSHSMHSVRTVDNPTL